MGVNRGKKFESIIQQAFEQTKGVAITRLHDQTTGFKGSVNPCDFIVYHKPYLFPIECKSIHGNTFPFSNITDFQWKSLLEMSTVKGVIAGVIVWFVDHDVTMFYNIKGLKVLKDAEYKSIKYSEELFGIPIIGKKKRVFFEYDIQTFLKEVESEYGTGN